MTSTVRVYQELNDHGMPSWVADGPAVTVFGYETAESAIDAYKTTARLNGVDLSTLLLEYGHFESIWVKH